MSETTNTRTQNSDDRPNILFLVWDACRYDFAEEEASTLRELGEENLWFENAIAPSTWSLPSHASMFTGLHPHEHGIYRATDSMDSVSLFERLKDDGYSLFGVSGNGFVSHSTNVHQWFDEFYYTSGQGPFLDGLTVYAHVFGQTDRDESLSPLQATLDTLRSVITHDHPLKSIVNFSAVGLNRIAAHAPPLQRIPHPVFNPYQPYSYQPNRNTTKIREFLRESADDDRPFFVFANYMDTHRPYHPPEKYILEHTDMDISYHELSRLNEEVENPWEFLSKHYADDIPEDDVDLIRELYRGEVDSVDDHLAILLDELERQGLRQDTIVVVTADHGENLGEVDDMGRRRMGHECSVSDPLLRVPLVVAHPDLEPRRVTNYANLKDLYHLFVSEKEALLASEGAELGSLEGNSKGVVTEYPAVGGRELYDRYESIPREVLRQRVEDHYSIAYIDEWRLVADSTGERWAWNEGESAEFDDAPESITTRCLEHLEALQADSEMNKLSDSDVDQLEALGYI